MYFCCKFYSACETTGSFIISPHHQQQSFDNPVMNNNNPAILSATIVDSTMTSPPGDLTSPPGDLGPECQLPLDQYSDEAGWSSEEWDDDSSNNTNVQDQIQHLVTVRFYLVL